MIGDTRPRSETPEHWSLKRIAYAFLYRRGYRMIAVELQVGGFRVDVAGAVDNGRSSRIAVVEAKASRADFLRDLRMDFKVAEALDALPNLEVAWELLRAARWGKQTWEQKEHEKSVRSALQRAKDLVRCWRTGPDGVLNLWTRASKFTDITLLSRTTERYVIAPPGVVREHELPTTWGLLSEDAGILRRSTAPGIVGDEDTWALSRQISRRSTWAGAHGVAATWRDRQPYPPTFADLVAAERRAPCEE